MRPTLIGAVNFSACLRGLLMAIFSRFSERSVLTVAVFGGPQYSGFLIPPLNPSSATAHSHLLELFEYF